MSTEASRIAELEEGLARQARDARSYNGEENLMLLKLYQFYPNKWNADMAFLALAKALTRLPSSDFTASLYLIPERLQKQAPLSLIIEMEGKLETAEFSEFWKFVAPHMESLEAKVSGFFGAVTDFIAGVLQLAYARVSVRVLRESLGVDDVSAVCARMGWTVSGEHAQLQDLAKLQSRQTQMQREALDPSQLSVILQALSS